MIVHSLRGPAPLMAFSHTKEVFFMAITTVKISGKTFSIAFETYVIVL